MEVIDLECVKEVAEKWGLRYVVLHGSQAKGYAKEFSDVDLAIKVGRELNFVERGRLYGEMEECVSGKLDLSFLDDWNPILAWEVLTNGKVIYARDLNEVIEDKVKAIVEVCDLEPLLKLSYKENKRALARLSGKGVES
ncbi:hypothetical protein IPA_07095 [Ignicoccus pacificus DSM 13166]|uniref:Polymerase beta nucleotidyltransferase domain-containing protein n=1 Tax=Ignicoccus pacificus DSM 13166 TaxID=940294 RepID=A0A977KBP5_9CREN|nr:hypothetical protein IPA_07095 [Ignicoccus pacificus DSM 13166]